MFHCRMCSKLLKPTEVCWTDEGQPVCKDHFIVCAYDGCQRTIEPPERHVWFDNGCGKPLPYHRDCARAEEREMRRRELRERDRQTQQAVGDFLLDIGKEWFDWKKPWGWHSRGGKR